MIILHDPATLLHDTVELLGSKLVPAYESPARVRAILDSIPESNHHLEHVQLHSPDEQQLLLNTIKESHGTDYLAHLRDSFSQWRENGLVDENGSILPECFPVPNKANASSQPPKDIFARTGYFAFDMSSAIMKDSHTSIIASANLARSAMVKLHSDKLSDIVALTRPPGHHCNGAKAGGYCYVNNVAVAASTWRRYAPGAKIGILDIDFHHGNGTQDIFYADGNTFYTSIHGEGEFPYYTGNAEEDGMDEGVGANLNFPLKPGSSLETYLELLQLALDALEVFAPEVLIVSLGFDTFRLDPLGSFQIDTEDYRTLGRRIRERLRDIPTAILLEGGYVVEHLGANLLSFLRGWEGS